MNARVISCICPNYAKRVWGGRTLVSLNGKLSSISFMTARVVRTKRGLLTTATIKK